MKNALFITFAVVFLINSAWSQSYDPPGLLLEADSLAVHYSQSITQSDLSNYISILASDALEGRDTGSRGQKMAAAFIREHFKDNKLEAIVPDENDSSYFQKIDLYRNYYQDVHLIAAEKKYQNLDEVAFIGNASIPQPESFLVQFTGNGEAEDYEGLKVEDYMVAFLAKTPEERRRKIQIAKENGAKAFLVLYTETKSDFKEFLDRNSHYFHSKSITKQQSQPGEDITFLTSYELLPEILGTAPQKVENAYQKAERSSRNPFRKLNNEVSLKIEKVSEKFETENVLGLVEGGDKKDEIIIITAHYDHVGKSGDQIYNGADDDASGTAAVMELAQAFAMAKKDGNGPRRSLLFMTVTGEEKGLLGSEYYSDNPVWPLDLTVANLNIDMIGRVDPAHEESDPYVYVIGSDRLSLDLHAINEQVNELYTDLDLDYTYNSTDDPNRFYYRSDHYNFAKHNIPIIFYFNGTHEDYHQPTDTVEKIRFDLLKKRSDLIFYCTWELANREQRIRLNP